MAYFLNLFSPETYEAFLKSDRSVSGFRMHQKNAASRIRPGDKLVCYVTKLSRWFGIFEVINGPYMDTAPIFQDEDDPFVVRFKVRPVVLLPKEKAVPIYDDSVWQELSWTQGHDKGTTTWTGKFRNSLNEIPSADGRLLERVLAAQAAGGTTYDVDEREYQKWLPHKVRREDRVVAVSVPESAEDEEQSVTQPAARDSHRMQALLADLGQKMGLRVWIPRADKERVQGLMNERPNELLSLLPLNYDDTTLKTIEQIDVLWLKGRAIVRAFEVEHTTSIYSGLLRMADLLALQPNMDIKLHIVAPEERKEKVFTEIRRPVFSLLERAPLAECCTYLSYGGISEIATLPHLSHLADSVLEDYAEEAE